MSSLDVAETFEKEHRNVLRDIRELPCSEDFRLLNFVAPFAGAWVEMIIENYGILMSPEENINVAELLNINSISHTKMEAIENSYIYGYMRGCSFDGTELVPVYNLKQMTDEEWIELSKKYKEPTR